MHNPSSLLERSGELFSFRSILACLLCFAWAASLAAQGGDERNQSDRTGIELAGRTENDAPPENWYVVDAMTKKQVAKLHRQWGFAPLPAGEYIVSLLPQGYQAVEIEWQKVTVSEGQVSKIELTSGVELAGRDEQDAPPENWFVVNAETKKRVAKVHQRFGFTPLPLGQYVVSVLPQGYQAMEIEWQKTKVAAGKISTVTVASGIELSGRDEQDAPPENWFVVDAETKKRVAKVHQRFGFTPLPPGEYVVGLLPQGYRAVEIEWQQVKFAAGEVSTVEIASGIEMLEPEGAKEPPEWWTVSSAGKSDQVAKVHQRWGFTPLPPGEYDVRRTPVDWTNVRVAAGSVTRLTEPELADRLATLTGAGRKTEKERDPEAYHKLEEAVERAVRRGAAWLKQHRYVTAMSPDERDDGYAALGVLALVHANELERDPELARQSTDYLLRRSLNTSYGTYVTGLTAMALRDIDAYRFVGRMMECGQWLVENQGGDTAEGVWGYGDKASGIGEAKSNAPRPAPSTAGPRKRDAKLEIVRRGLVSDPRDSWDNSNTQFAVLGLHSTVHSGIQVPADVWKKVDNHFRRTQRADGGWGYSGGSATGSMTCSGAASVLIARRHQGEARPALDSAVVNGLAWLAANFTVEKNPQEDQNHYYYLYGLERVGVLAQTEFIGRNEWYPIGARYLIDKQADDGSWTSNSGPPTGNDKAFLDTCYAILFLRRATLPLEPIQPAFLSVSRESGKLPAKLLPAVELILDSSGSMRELVGGESKNLIAQQVVREALSKLRDGEVQVGLRLFGHRGVYLSRKNSPTAAPLNPNDPQLDRDSELVVPIEPLDDRKRAKIGEWLAWAAPRGKTPLVYSLLQARGDFPAGDAERTVVLVSDGQDTCGGKLESVAEAYRATDVELVIHVVGFDVQESEAAQLREIARIGRGKYYSADSAEGLAQALRSTVRGTSYEVLAADGSTVLARGDVNGDDLPLKPGNYLVRLSRSRAAPLPVALEPGQTLNLMLDEAGRLAVRP